jgi:hypothetical protein
VEQHAPFPRLEAHDLTGAKRWLPDAFEGERNLVFVAFRREQQAVIDSWTTWLEIAARVDIMSYEVPVLARRWAPLRPMIDGGMAAAIRDLGARRRTLTVYGDVRRVTDPLGITDRSSVWIFLVARGGAILEVVTGGYDEASAERLWLAAQEGGAAER